MHKLNSKIKLPSKDKESTHLYQYISSSWDSTEVNYTVPSDDKPTKYEFLMMGKAQEIYYWENRKKIIIKNQNE